MNEISCPHCGLILADDGSLAGQSVACPQCGGTFLMPSAPTPPPAVDAPIPSYGSASPEPPPVKVKIANSPRIVTYLLIGIAIALVVVIGLLWSRLGLSKPAAKPTSMAKSRPVAHWIHQLQTSPTEAKRRRAASAIADLGPTGVATALGQLTSIGSAGKSYTVDKAAMSYLAAMGPEISDSLTQALRSKDEKVRIGAAHVLREMGDKAGFAREAVDESLEDESRLVRRLAARVLGDLGVEAAPSVGKLTHLLDNDDAHSRLYAAQALGRIGPPAREAVPVLKRLLEEDNVIAVRQAAEQALTQIALEEVAAKAEGQASDEMLELIKKLGDEDDVERVAAAKALAARGPEAVEAVPALVRALQHEDKWLREAAAKVLGAIGAPAAKAVPALERAAKDKEPEVSEAAQTAIMAIRGKPKDE